MKIGILTHLSIVGLFLPGRCPSKRRHMQTALNAIHRYTYIVFINSFPLQNAAQNCRKRANDRLSDLTEDVHEKKRKKEECVAELERVKRIYEDELSRYFKIERWAKSLNNNFTWKYLILIFRFILKQYFKKDDQTHTLREIRKTGGLIAVEKERPQVGMIQSQNLWSNKFAFILIFKF